LKQIKYKRNNYINKSRELIYNILMIIIFFYT